MAVIEVNSSLLDVAKAPSLRCDTHYGIHHRKWMEFYASIGHLTWVSLDSLVHRIRNGLNLGTEFYSIEPTEFVYLSVSQISPFGFENKNLTYLREDVESLDNFFSVGDRTLLITRSGTVGVAMSGDHPSLDHQKKYVPSGFVITAELRPDVQLSPRILAGYLNVPQLQSLIVSLAAGGNQKNISQEVFTKIPVPLRLVEDQDSSIKSAIEAFNAAADRIKEEREALEKRIAHEEQALAQRIASQMRILAEG